MLEKTGSMELSVLPEPVLAMITTFFPFRMGGMPLFWGSVSSTNPRSSNADRKDG
jgi:hypothetical protein